MKIAANNISRVKKRFIKINFKGWNWTRNWPYFFKIKPVQFPDWKPLAILSANNYKQEFVENDVQNWCTNDYLFHKLRDFFYVRVTSYFYCTEYELIFTLQTTYFASWGCIVDCVKFLSYIHDTYPWPVPYEIKDS